MPATAVAPVTVSRNVANGVDLTAALTAADATNGNSFVNDGTTLLRVKNGSGSPVTVTVHFQGTLTPAVDGVTLTGTSAGKQYSVPATTGDRLIGPFPTATYGTNLHVDYSADTSVTVAAYKLTN